MKKLTADEIKNVVVSTASGHPLEVISGNLFAVSPLPAPDFGLYAPSSMQTVVAACKEFYGDNFSQNEITVLNWLGEKGRSLHKPSGSTSFSARG